MLFGQFLLQAPCYVIRTVSLTRPMLFYAESFSYTPRAILSGGFSYMPQAILCEEFFCAHPSLLVVEDGQTNARTR